MHVVIAVLEDDQFDRLQQSGIPHREIPQAFVTELRAIFPTADLADIAERSFKRVLAEAKIEAERARAANDLEVYRRQTIIDLGLDSGGPGKVQ